MKSTIATILVTATVGLIKDKLGSMSKSKKLSYKEFDAYSSTLQSGLIHLKFITM